MPGSSNETSKRRKNANAVKQIRDDIDSLKISTANYIEQFEEDIRILNERMSKVEKKTSKFSALEALIYD